MIKTNIFIKLILLLSLLLVTAGQAAAASDDGLVPIPPLKALVTDLTGTLTPAQINELDTMLKKFESASGSQIAVLIVPTTKPEEIEQYSIRVADQWKLGRKGIDDGILLLIAKDDKKVRIEVGYGLEGAIPDAIAKRIIEEQIIPHFKNGDFYGGINVGVDTMIRIIGGEPLPPPQKTRTTKNIDSTDTWVILFFVGVFATMFLQKIFGKFLGSAATGSIVGFIGWVVMGTVFAAIIIGIIAFIIALFISSDAGRGGFGGGSGWGGGGFGGGGGWGGGGGGGFGGGGASGSW